MCVCVCVCVCVRARARACVCVFKFLMSTIWALKGKIGHEIEMARAGDEQKKNVN